MRRKLMMLLGLLVATSLILTACAPAPEAGAPAAGEPAAAPAAEEPTSGLGELPRNETLIAHILTGRVGSPSNFNEWVGWKNRSTKCIIGRVHPARLHLHA